MSGDRNSGGFDINAFGDWAGMYNVLGAGSGSSPGTQDSTTAAAYQTPHFDVDAYRRSSPANVPGLSHMPENFPDEQAEEEAAQAEEEEGADEVLVDVGRHPYSHKETLTLYEAWVAVSYDPVVGNQQSRLCFWEKVTELYNSKKPKGTHRRNVKMLRGHFDRCDRQVKKFCSIYQNEEAHYQSGASGADILRAALRVFKDDTGKHFNHVDVWAQVRHLERWAGGVPSSSMSKRTKHTASGQYSSSDGGGSGNTSQEVEATPTDEAGGSGSGSRRRPQGTKAAKAARSRGRGRGRGESSQAGSGSGSDSNTLMSMYLLATMADTSQMPPAQYEAHLDGIEHLRQRIGIRPRSNLGAQPPTSGDDSPAD